MRNTTAPSIRLVRDNSAQEINKALRDLQDAMFARTVVQPTPGTFAYQTADLVLDGSVSNDYANVPGLQLDLTEPGTWLISATISVDGTSGDQVAMRLASNVPPTNIPSATLTGTYGLSGQWLVTTKTGSESVQIQAADLGSSTATIMAWNGTRGYGSISAVLISNS